MEDDGVGISEEKLGTLLEHAGIGVSNVNERLKVLFGSEYRMWIESQPGQGTRVNRSAGVADRLGAVSSVTGPGVGKN